MRQTAYGHIHEIASAPASRLRSPCEVENPLTFANHERLTRFPAPRVSLSGSSRPQVSLEIMRAVGNAPWKHDRSGFAPTARPVFRRFGPRYSHGPTVLKRRARSLLGVLRAPLLRRQPSIPLSPTCCHGHLECVRRASRGPSRQVSLAERGRGWPHKLA